MDNTQTLLDKIKESGAWITLVTAGFLLIFLFTNYVQGTKQQEILDKQTANTNALVEQTKTLSEDNKKLSEENKALADRSVKYAYCNAVLLAQYTQTGNAIQIQDLENCILTSFPDGIDILNPESQATQRLNSNQGSGTTQTAQNTPVNNTPTSLNPQPSNPSPQPQPRPTPNPTPTAQPVSMPILTIGSTFLTPKVELDAPCIGVPRILSIC